ncbi:MAG TPA: phenylalanine--tRNA ligase subunit alpha [Thermoplasmata archaeon]|nr:phenylalanine--tRNA ligase subunit alpha [Thermoplasmata archaeon]
MEKQAAELALNEKKVLLSLQELGGKATTGELKEKGGFDELVEVKSAISWLETKSLVQVNQKIEKKISLSEEGMRLDRKGLPERRAAEFLLKGGGKCGLEELTACLNKEEISPAIGWLKKKGWATLKNKVLELTNEGKQAVKTRGEDEKAIALLAEKKELEASKFSPSLLSSLKKRKRALVEKENVIQEVRATDSALKLLESGIELKEEISDLSPSLIKSGEWKNTPLRRYDVTRYAPPLWISKPHPITQLIDRLRKTFLELGFTEIRGNYIEPCFWPMDALFIPQYHPDRSMQSTFYLKTPSSLDVPSELLDVISQVHQNGWETSSRGWEYDFSKEEAKNAILRTHTTVNTIRWLHENPKVPLKIFSIEKAFRREAIDSTHLPEFHQIEGIICEKGANLRRLMGVLKESYHRLGFDQIRFKPAYFPYTEPSIEVEILWNGRWLELGGSGIFRPEVMAPTKIKEPVLAWGLGLERLAMLTFGLKDMRELYTNDLEKLQKLTLI